MPGWSRGESRGNSVRPLPTRVSRPQWALAGSGRLWPALAASTSSSPNIAFLFLLLRHRLVSSINRTSLFLRACGERGLYFIHFRDLSHDGHPRNEEAIVRQCIHRTYRDVGECKANKPRNSCA